MIRHAKVVNGRTYGYKCAKKVKAALKVTVTVTEPAQDRVAQLEQEVKNLKGIMLKLQKQLGNQTVWKPLAAIPNGDSMPGITHNTDYADCVSELKTVLASRLIN